MRMTQRKLRVQKVMFADSPQYGHNGYLLILLENGLINSFEVFRLCTCSLAIDAQAHH